MDVTGYYPHPVLSCCSRCETDRFEFEQSIDQLFIERDTLFVSFLLRLRK